LNGLGGRYYISFDSFASRTVLRDGSAEDYQTVFRHLLEEFETLRDFDDGVLNIFSSGGRFYVGSCSVLLLKHRNHFADLTTRRHIKGNKFCSSAFLGRQRFQCSFQTKSLEGCPFGTQIAVPRLDRRATPQWNR
jgi:hypothetical protein